MNFVLLTLFVIFTPQAIRASTQQQQFQCTADWPLLYGASPKNVSLSLLKKNEVFEFSQKDDLQNLKQEGTQLDLLELQACGTMLMPLSELKTKVGVYDQKSGLYIQNQTFSIISKHQPKETTSNVPTFKPRCKTIDMSGGDQIVYAEVTSYQDEIVKLLFWTAQGQELVQGVGIQGNVVDQIHFNTSVDNVLGFKGKLIKQQNGDVFLSQISFLTKSDQCPSKFGALIEQSLIGGFSLVIVIGFTIFVCQKVIKKQRNKKLIHIHPDSVTPRLNIVETTQVELQQKASEHDAPEHFILKDKNGNIINLDQLTDDHSKDACITNEGNFDSQRDLESGVNGKNSFRGNNRMTFGKDGAKTLWQNKSFLSQMSSSARDVSELPSNVNYETNTLLKDNSQIDSVRINPDGDSFTIVCGEMHLSDCDYETLQKIVDKNRSRQSQKFFNSDEEATKYSPSKIEAQQNENIQISQKINKMLEDLPQDEICPNMDKENKQPCCQEDCQECETRTRRKGQYLKEFAKALENRLVLQVPTKNLFEESKQLSLPAINEEDYRDMNSPVKRQKSDWISEDILKYEMESSQKIENQRNSKMFDSIKKKKMQMVKHSTSKASDMKRIDSSISQTSYHLQNQGLACIR